MSTSHGPWFERENWANDGAYLAAGPEERALIDDFRAHGFVVLPELIDPSRCRAVIDALEPVLGTDGAPLRLTNAWERYGPVRALAGDPEVLDVLELLYQRRPIPFQTLDFRVGTQQHPHADTIHFDSLPSGFMCGAWVALEDIGPDQGPLVYHPGSHSDPRLRPECVTDRPDRFDVTRYEAEVAAAVAERGPVEVTASQGDVFIWSAGLVHGGAPIRSPGSTRWSQVTHYFFEDCVYLTPMESDYERGEYRLRIPLVDVTTGRSVPHLVDGRPARLEHLRSGRTRILDDAAPDLPATRRIASAWRAARRRLRWRAGHLLRARR